MFASEYGHVEVVKELVAKGAAVNQARVGCVWGMLGSMLVAVGAGAVRGSDCVIQSCEAAGSMGECVSMGWVGVREKETLGQQGDVWRVRCEARGCVCV